MNSMTFGIIYDGVLLNCEYVTEEDGIFSYLDVSLGFKLPHLRIEAACSIDQLINVIKLEALPTYRDWINDDFDTEDDLVVEHDYPI